jgi:hypothetical protein
MECRDSETVAYIAYSAIGTSGFFLSSFLAIAYFKDPVLSRCPGGLVMFRCSIKLSTTFTLCLDGLSSMGSP